MDEIKRLIAEKRSELREALKPIFQEDSSNAAAILIAALLREFGDPISEADRQRFLDALAQLPKGSKAKPGYLIGSYDKGSSNEHWKVTFTDEDGNIEYQSSKQFATEPEANAYATEFLIRLRGEINKP